MEATASDCTPLLKAVRSCCFLISVCQCSSCGQRKLRNTSQTAYSIPELDMMAPWSQSCLTFDLEVIFLLVSV